MNDTSAAFEERINRRYAQMSSEERMRIAASLYESARAIIGSSLPAGLTDEERRYAIAKRLYGDELPEAALVAHAKWGAR